MRYLWPFALSTLISLGAWADDEHQEEHQVELAVEHHEDHSGHDHGAHASDDLQFMGALDLVLFGNSDSALVDENRMQIRSTELRLSAPVDSRFDGVLSFAGHSHGGAFIWDLHEAFLQSEQLLPNTQVRVGKFLLGIGRLNRSHQHEWIFTVAPKVHREFFADEAAIDTGLQLTHSLTPNLNITLGLTNGYCYGHCDQLGRRPVTPLHYLRAEIRTPRSATGLNYWSYTDFSGERVWHTGVDWIWRKLSHKRTKHLAHIEGYYRNKLPQAGTAQVDTGVYGVYQYFHTKRWSSAYRIDLFSELNRRWELVDERRENMDYGLNLNTSYHASEQATFRAGITREVATQRGVGAQVNDRVELQLVYLLGSHSHHDF